MALHTTTTEIPPGIEGDYTHVCSSGHEHAWMPYTKVKYYTNAFIIRDGKVSILIFLLLVVLTALKILLGHKKRGYGKGMYNGFGGKVEPGETSLEAAQRELEEESGVNAPLERAGILLFLPADGQHMFHIDVYRADEYTGEPVETDEMVPQWFTIPSNLEVLSEALPFDKMWDTDSYWYPMLLAKQFFVGRVDNLGAPGNFATQKWWFGVTSEARS